MDGQSPEGEIQLPPKDRPQVQAFATKREAIRSLDSERPDLDNRFVADISTGNIFFVKQQYDPSDIEKDRVQHKDIVEQLVAEGKMKSASDARGGYIIVVNSEEGKIMHAGKAGSIDAFAEDDRQAQIEFDKFFNNLKEGDPKDPHLFVVDRNYGSTNSKS